MQGWHDANELSSYYPVPNSKNYIDLTKVDHLISWCLVSQGILFKFFQKKVIPKFIWKCVISTIYSALQERSDTANLLAFPKQNSIVISCYRVIIKQYSGKINKNQLCFESLCRPSEQSTSITVSEKILCIWLFSFPVCSEITRSSYIKQPNDPTWSPWGTIDWWMITASKSYCFCM